MSRLQSVMVNGRAYRVGVNATGQPSITTTWDALVPSTAYSARPEYSVRSRAVSANGRLGKKIMELANKEAAK